MDNSFDKELKQLPEDIYKKSIRSGNEYGWRQADFPSVIEAIRKASMAIIGGQVQYKFPDGICELYWLSYDTDERSIDEDWDAYCNRTAKECLAKFELLISTKNIDQEALEWPFIQTKKNQGIDINQFQIFILYFNDEASYSSLFSK